MDSSPSIYLVYDCVIFLATFRIFSIVSKLIFVVVDVVLAPVVVAVVVVSISGRVLTVVRGLIHRRHRHCQRQEANDNKSKDQLKIVHFLLLEACQYVTCKVCYFIRLK